MLSSVADVDAELGELDLFCHSPFSNADQTPEPRGQIRDRQVTSPSGAALRRVLRMGSTGESPRSPRGSAFEVKTTALVTSVRDACDMR